MSSLWRLMLTPRERNTLARVWGKPVKYLGHGTNAHAWLLESDRVAKITEDPSEITRMAGLVNVKHLPRVVRIFSVRNLGDNRAAIVEEYLEPLTGEESERVQFWYEYSHMSEAFGLGEMRRALKLLGRLPREELLEEYVAVIQALVDYGVPMHDIGPWNLGWDRHNKLKAIELGTGQE